jgi:hypothetical protein
VIWIGRGIIMYIDAYIAIPLWVFALYGFYCLLMRVFTGLNLIRQKKKGVYTLIVSAKNQEEAIEGVVRSFILKSGIDSAEEKLLQIVLLDLGSGDKTPEIMESLGRDYSVVKLLRPDDLPSYVKGLV